MIKVEKVICRLFLALAILLLGEARGLCGTDGPDKNQIWYTSSDGNVVRPKPKAFTQKVLSNVYKNGKGVITFDGELTKIGPSAFNGSTNLRSIQVPEGIRSIEVYAFFECEELVNVVLPEGVVTIAQKAFSGCGKLSGINFPESLSEIKVAAFENCSSLKKATFHKAIRTLETGAFSGCSSLEEVSFEEGLTELGQSAFYDCKSLRKITIPKTIKDISKYCFYNCESLEEVYVPETLEYLGYGVFVGCKKLRRFAGYGASSDGRSIVLYNGYLRAVALAGLIEYTVPPEASKIDDSVFSRSDIQRVVIPEGVDYIGSYAFASCERLESIFIPATVTSTGVNPFENSPRLSRIEGPLASADGRCLIIKDVLVSAAIGDITDYHIQEGVRKIGKEAFCDCYHLETVTFPSTLTSIRDDAFQNCTSLSRIDLPQTLSYIKYDAFLGCKSIKSVTIRALNPPELSNRHCFEYADVIYVPRETIQAYKSDEYWGWYFEKMREIK